MSKKLLVAYDEAGPDAGRGDFLCVVRQSDTPVFWGLRSKRPWAKGLAVYVGKDVSHRDLFAKLVESGRKIGNVQLEMERLAAYLRQLDDLKIGNIVSVAPKLSEPGFELAKVADMPRTDPRRLP